MHKHILLLFILIFIEIECWAQQRQFQKNEIGISAIPFFNGKSNYSLGATKGLYYIRHDSNLSWVSSVEYAKYQWIDRCSTCYDDIHRQGAITEFIAATGVRFNFYKKRNIKVKPFFETSFCYFYFRDIEESSGGFGGAFYEKHDKSYNMYGALLRLGIIYKPLPKICLTLSSFVASTAGQVKNNYTNSSYRTDGGTAAALHFRVGYLF